MTATRKWSLMATVLVLAVFAAGWFLLISPKRSEAARLDKKAVSQEAANARLEQQIQVLQAQQAELPQQRAKLAVMRRQIPDNPALPTLIRNLTAASRKAGAGIQSLAPSLPVAMVAQPAAPVAATTAPQSSTSATGTEAGSAATSTAATPVAVPPSLYQVPLKVEIVGSYFELEQFVNKLEGLKRSFQVTGFTVEPDEDAEAAGDLKLSLDGRVFLSPPAPATTPTSTPVASAPAAQ